MKLGLFVHYVNAEKNLWDFFGHPQGVGKEAEKEWLKSRFNDIMKDERV